MDYLVKALALQNQVRVYLVKNKDIVNETIRRHDLWPSASSALGKVMSVGLMMGAMLKNDEALTIKLNGNGPIGNIIVDANGTGTVRGYVDNPHINFVGKNGLDDSFAIGNSGLLEVIKDLKLKDFFTSTIETTGNVASDFTYYFMESEQTPSAVYLGILIDVDNKCRTSGGMVFQLLPGTSDETITKLEECLKRINSVSTLIENCSLEEILELLFEEDFEVLETKNVKFECTCSKENFARGLITLGVKDLEELLHEEKEIKTTCHYCCEQYSFNESEIEKLIEEAKKK